jgi:hypothetical protein
MVNHAEPRRSWRRRVETVAGHLSGTADDAFRPAAAVSVASVPGRRSVGYALAAPLPLTPPSFLAHQTDEARRFFDVHGFVLISDALSPREQSHLSDWYTRSQRDQLRQWCFGCSREGDLSLEWLYHQPLLNYEELDPFVRHPSHYGLVALLLGGESHARFSEFDFRQVREIAATPLILLAGLSARAGAPAAAK